MKPFEIAYLPIGVGTFHLESARAEFEQSAALLRSLDGNVRVPDDLLLTVDRLSAFLETVSPDLIVLQNATFANGAYAEEVLARFPNAPILLWTLREPVIDGGRLRLNSLTGAYSAANAIRRFREGPFEYVFGSPAEDAVQKRVAAVVRAARLLFEMKSMRLVQIGHTPEGFGFGRALDLEMRKTFGVKLESVEARELIDRARSFTDEDAALYLAKAKDAMSGLDKTPDRNRLDFARLYKAYDEFVTERHVDAIASRCWPDFFTSFGTPVCAVLAMLNDRGVAASCEADAYGALSMALGRKLTGTPAFFGDPVSLDEAENTISFWHCGTAACSLAREDTGACVGVHCNRRIGPTLEFGCKAAPAATVFRIGQDRNGAFRFFICSGEVLDKPRQFLGTSLVVRTNAPAKEIVEATVLDGWEPHYTVLYGDCADELEILARMLDLPVLRY